jgi:sterol desaturase/sphingolipid hydroxylase (fatty acid hydroxylase superfamily)
VSISLASEFSHPVDYFITGLIPSSVGNAILGPNMHYFGYLVWVFIRVSETNSGHCGYDFPWNPYSLIPFSTTSPYHDFHHSKNVGNYSSLFRTWDTIFGTNKVYFESIKKKEEKNE